ncbi:hypothetical protein [Salicibibacter cibarius]|nr:hypothetical protein [Salicibibacter cibarius]
MMQTLAPDEGYDAYCQFVYTDPEGKVTIYEGENNPVEIELGETDRSAELKFTQDADIGLQFWLGELDLQQAMARQQIQAEGPLAKAMQVLPQIEKIHPRAYLEKNGREDVLVKKN